MTQCNDSDGPREFLLSDEAIEIAAARIVRFGWPYKQNARAVAQVMLEAVAAALPGTEQGA